YASRRRVGDAGDRARPRRDRRRLPAARPVRRRRATAPRAPRAAAGDDAGQPARDGSAAPHRRRIRRRDGADGGDDVSVARKQRDVLSVEWVKLELIRTAYSTRGGLFAAMDPRAVLGWYLILALAP